MKYLVRYVLIRLDGIPEIKWIYKELFSVPMEMHWPDGTYGKFKKISKKGNIFYQQL